MAGTPFVSIRDLLTGPLTPLGRLTTIGRRLDAANRALDELLAEPLRGHLRVARVTGDTLTLVADSPAWSTLARYQTPQILEHLGRRLDQPDLARARLLARPPERPVASSRRAVPRQLSARAAALIESVAQATENEALGRSLMRLARRASPDQRD